MCGFLGYFSPNPEKISNNFSLEPLLKHRGPDEFQEMTGHNFHAMFWRLSIVDQEKSHQPMTSKSSQVTVSFNGEIYNYKSLRNELKALGSEFHTDGDTEVILRAYEKWGNNCYKNFDGMYAILIIDPLKNKFSLIRDRLGVKPLYFKQGFEEFYVASEQKAILKIMDQAPRVDRSSLIYYLNFQSVPNNKTLFDGINKVAPGYVYEYNLNNRHFIGSIKIEDRINYTNFKNYAEYREILREEIFKQTALTLDTDLPICFHISGGIDSNSLIGLCRKLNPKRDFTCVTSIVDGQKDDEWDFIKKSAEYHKVDVMVADINENTFFEYFDDVLYYLDEPVGDAGAVAQFMVNELASKKSKIVYSGQGFDELFFGYSRDLAAYVLHNWGSTYLDSENTNFKKLPETIQNFFSGWENFLAPLSGQPAINPMLALFKKLCRFDPFVNNDFLPTHIQEQLQANAYGIHERIIGQSKDFHDYIIQAETMIQLPSLLHMEDRASMRYSIETRVPFCTSSILDLARMAQLDWKFLNNKPKGILRDIFSDIIPKHILNREKKVGRPIPFQSWVRNGKHNQYLKSLKKKKDLFHDLLGFDYVGLSLKNDEKYDRTIWGAICLSQWMELHHLDQ